MSNIRTADFQTGDYRDHRTTEPFSVGRAGNGKVDLFSGKLEFYHQDFSLKGLCMPLSLSHVYSERWSTEIFNIFNTIDKMYLKIMEW